MIYKLEKKRNKICRSIRVKHLNQWLKAFDIKHKTQNVDDLRKRNKRSNFHSTKSPDQYFSFGRKASRWINNWRFIWNIFKRLRASLWIVYTPQKILFYGLISFYTQLKPPTWNSKILMGKWKPRRQWWWMNENMNVEHVTDAYKRWHEPPCWLIVILFTYKNSSINK